MLLNEEAVRFGAGRSLAGVLTHPANFDCARPAILLLNVGLVHRAGPNRLYVKLARRFAELGFLVLRFDFSGIGDSQRRDDAIPQNRAHPLETQEAMDHLEAAWGTRRFLSMGICRGAWASFGAACQDPRLVGLVLINPDTLADDRRSAIRDQRRSAAAAGSLARPGMWLRALRDPARYRAEFAMLISHTRARLRRGDRVREAGQVAERVRALAERGVEMLFIFSELDPGRDYIIAILGRLSGTASDRIVQEVIPKATHAFLSLASQRLFAAAVERWIARFTRGDSVARKAAGITDN
jgi:pimeloyl-ACP methyl ester carboxylesterase